MDRLGIRYARTPDGLHIAYQVAGEGSVDLVYVPGWISNLDLVWDLPGGGDFLRSLASMARLIVFDRRGSGLSDRPPSQDSLALEFGIEDIRAVLDAVEAERAVIFGFEDGGILSAAFAATYPERTQALVLFAAWVRYRQAPDYPWGSADAYVEEFQRHLEQEWGTEAFWRYNLETVAPAYGTDDAFVREWTRFSRMSASPGAIQTIERALRETDGRAILPTIQVPTLVLHREGDLSEPVDQSRYIADRIPGAELRILPGRDHPPFLGDTAPVLKELARFVASVREEEADFDRVLATVLFTDIVDSSSKASELGDRAWRDLIERHHGIVRALLRRFRGTEVDTAGDGFFATFDGPARAVRCAMAVVDAVGPLGLEVRAGVHTGEVETIDGKAGGIGVVIGARVGSLSRASEVLVSQTVKDLVAGSGLVFEASGEHELKGVPDRWRLYRVVG